MGTRRADNVGASWPALGFEEHPWTIPESISRSQRAKLANVYTAAVVAPIAEVVRVPLGAESEALVAEATSQITRFDAELGADPAPFAALLLRSESAASSKIENLTASAKAIALAELGGPGRRNAAIIVANTRAMQAALALADRLDEDAILAMHAALIEATHPEWCGHWRDEQVWIGGSNYGPFGAAYVAPHHSRVAEGMVDLVRFLRREDVPALTLAAAGHAQFEAVHPFPDGNGRVGRALIHAVLKAKGVTRQVTVPVSAGLLSDTDGYVAALDVYRSGDPEPLVHPGTPRRRRVEARRPSPSPASRRLLTGAAGSGPTGDDRQPRHQCPRRCRRAVESGRRAPQPEVGCRRCARRARPFR